MTQHTMHAVRRHLTQALDRKASLRLLGVAAVAAATQQIPEAAAKKGKNKGSNQLCFRQRDPCLLFIQTICQQRRLAEAKIAIVDTTEECVAALKKCCDQISRCELGDGLECIVTKNPNTQK